MFKRLFPASAIYAILYTFCLYKNINGITMPLFSVATVAYCFYSLKLMGQQIKKSCYFYSAVIVLIGISSFLTNNSIVVSLNRIGIFLMVIGMLVHNSYDDRKWTLSKNFGAFCLAIFSGFAAIPEPFKDAADYAKSSDKASHARLLYAMVGAIISVPLLAIIIVLLSFADAVFSNVINDIVDAVDFSNIFGIVALFVWICFCSYCLIRGIGKREISEETKDLRHFEPIIAITVLALISVVYLVFSVIQILYLFTRQFALPNGYTYADYAHEGFFELLFVCMLNLVIVLFTLGFFRENKIAKTLLLIISGCTFIMLASSAFRMCLYVSVYGFTFLRIFVLWFLFLLALLLVGIAVQIIKHDFNLFRYGLVVVSVCYLVFAFGQPDYWIAKYNTTQISEDRIDYEYLSCLSTDAAPVLANIDNSSLIRTYKTNCEAEYESGVRHFNVSRYRARSLGDGVTGSFLK